mmetsp:Transcript_1749/g.6934  ORF Transcript_1749/g.6934 Transcript_1749/m.6934 type:complete len:265 (-) Transcript_1749:3099-3893(-)
MSALASAPARALSAQWAAARPSPPGMHAARDTRAHAWASSSITAPSLVPATTVVSPTRSERHANAVKRTAADEFPAVAPEGAQPEQTSTADASLKVCARSPLAVRQTCTPPSQPTTAPPGPEAVPSAATAVMGSRDEVVYSRTHAPVESSHRRTRGPLRVLPPAVRTRPSDSSACAARSTVPCARNDRRQRARSVHALPGPLRPPSSENPTPPPRPRVVVKPSLIPQCLPLADASEAASDALPAPKAGESLPAPTLPPRLALSA